jgi:hypothetical protein
MLEYETLGPIVTLAPGKSTELAERWQLTGDVQDFKDEAEIDRNVAAKVAGPGKPMSGITR